MDLHTETQRLRLDLLAVALSDALRRAGIPHALLKGPSTANWLYHPPRPYRDVDLLVAHSRLADAVAVLGAADLARAVAGVVGEEAEHSLLLLSPAGFEVDLHVSLPTVPPAGDQVWAALVEHIEPLRLDVGDIPALDEPARCLVLALHALGGTTSAGQPADDLRRARSAAAAQSWASAERLAAAIGAADLFRAGIALVEGTTSRAALGPRARLYVEGAPSAAFGLQRLAEARLRDRPGLIWREVLPSRGFMQHAAAGPEDGSASSVTRAHARRWARLLRGLPAAVRAWRAVGR